jgi:hypothetical protein
MVERPLLTHKGMHTAHTGGGFCILDVQFDIGWKLAGVTVWA